MKIASAASIGSLVTPVKQPKGIRKRPQRRSHARGSYVDVVDKSHLATKTNCNTILHVSFSKENSFKWQSAYWRACPALVSPTERLIDLPHMLRGMVMQRVAKDGSLRCFLDNRHHVLRMWSSATLPESQSREVVSLNERSRFDLLSDLFLEASAPNLILRIDIRLKVCRIKQAALSLAEQILLPEYIDSEAQYRAIRIGYVPVVDAFRSEVQERRHGGHPDGVAYVQPLLAWADRDTDTIHFSRVHAYDFDDFCIGNPNEWTPWNRVAFSNSHYYLGSLEQVQKRGESKVQFLKRLKRLIDDEDENQMGSGVPFLPSYCYNVYRADEFGLGMACFPKQGIDVAVTFINKFDACDKVRHVAFPRDVRIVVDEKDGVSDIVELLRTLINRRGKQDGATFDSDKLFAPEHAGKWDLQLWVMPQNGPRKLYRYDKDKLDQFLSPALTVRTRDKRLYLEAHVVPSN